MASRYAGFVAIVILALLIGFQLLLAAGIPLGQAAWGGEQAVLPVSLRLGSLAAAGVLGMAEWILLARAGYVRPGAQSKVIRLLTWGFAGFLLLNTLGNLLSQSPVERIVMAPAALLLAICFIIVARS